MSESLPYWKQTITVCNKLNGKDSSTGKDTWKKTVVHNCFFKQKVSSSVSGTQVSIGASYIVRIPQNDDYKPYNEWKSSQIGFTLSVGDYIFKEEISEAITADNIISVFNSHKPDAMFVKAVSDVSEWGILPHYHVEGV